MNATRVTILCLALVTNAFCAPEPAEPTAKLTAAVEIEALRTSYNAALAANVAEREKWIAALDKWYLDALDTLQAERLKAADLDGAVAVKAERERIAARGDTMPEQIRAMPTALRALRATYEGSQKKIAEEEARRNVAPGKKYLADLEALQKRITMSGDIERALIVKGEKERFAAAMAANAPVLAAPSAIPSAPVASATQPTPPANDASKENGISKSLVGPWKFIWEQDGWIGLRDFNADGTLIGSGSDETTGPGRWEIADNKIIVTFPGGIREEMLLPLDPNGTKVIAKRGRELRAVKDGRELSLTTFGGRTDVLTTMAAGGQRKEGLIVVTNPKGIKTTGTFRPPLAITYILKTDNQVRLRYAADEIIFNWEGNKTELRIDGGPVNKQHRQGAGTIPVNQFITIRQVVMADKMTISVDGQERASWRGDFAKVKQDIGIKPFNGSTVWVKQVLVNKTQ